MSEETITGTVEVVDRDGRPVKRITVAQVPLYCGITWGLVDLAEVAPEAVGTVTPVAQWRGLDDRSQPVIVKLWREPEVDETFVGQVAAAMQQQEGT